MLQTLPDATFTPPVALADEDTCPALDLRLHELNYGAVALIAREQQSSEPFALAIVEVPAGAETTSEQIIRALYHTDLRLQILALLGPGSVPGKALMDAATCSSRLSCLRLPCAPEDFRQMVKVMTGKWARERAHEAQQAKEPAPAAAPEGNSSPSESAFEELNLATIGSLAFGVAHEFNNFLTVVQSQMDMAVQQAQSLPEVVNLLTQVMDSARSASHLSRKLISLTPSEKNQPVAVTLPDLVEDEVAMLRKTLGEQLVLTTDNARDLPAIWADPAKVSQILMHVAVHAKAGMPGGALQFTTRAVTLTPDGPLANDFPTVAPGRYVMLMVEDPNPQTSETASAGTSEQERLAWLENAVSKCDGAFSASLIPGVTRVYRMLFPLAEQGARTEVPAAAEPSSTKAAPATILVVDDDETICSVMTQVLSNAQHRVLIATNADQGWSQWRQHQGTIKLLITDINMPGGANGVALGQAVQEEDGSVPVIYTSGYRATSQFTNLIPGANYLPKPFGMNDLLTVVGRNLGQHRRHGLD